MSKIPQKAIEAAAKAMCNSWCYAPIGTPDGDQEWKRKQDQYRIQAKAALEAADATRAQGAEVEPGKDIAKQRFELWFFRDILDEHRLKLLTLFGVPANDQTGQTHGFQKRVLRHIWLSLTAPPAPQPTEREKVLEDALREICRVSWPTIGGAGLDMQKIAKAALAGEAPIQTELDSQPRYTTKRLRDEVAKAKNYARIEALEDAARQAEKVPCEPWKSIAAAIRQLKAPSQTDRAEGVE